MLASENLAKVSPLRCDHDGGLESNRRALYKAQQNMQRNTRPQESWVADSPRRGYSIVPASLLPATAKTTMIHASLSVLLVE